MKLKNALPKSPGMAGPEREVYLEVRWPDGRRFDSRKRVTGEQARMLVAGGTCEEVRSPSGVLRYLRMRRNPILRTFGTVSAQCNFTVEAVGNLYEHKVSKRSGL